MDNPLDTAGNAVKNVGEYGSQALFGFARFLEQITGDAVSAAIFAGFLLFALTLIKGAGLSRNSHLFSTSIALLGAIGFAGYLVYSLVQGVYMSSSTDEAALIEQGLNGIQNSAASTFFNATVAALSQYFWYGMVFLVMALVGTLLTRVLKTNRNSVAQSVD